MFSKKLFILAHQICDRNFYTTCKKLLHSQWKPYSEQKKDQEKQLKHMVSFAYKSVSYYHKLFKELAPSDIRMIEDLEKLSILTKDIIKENWKDFKPANLDDFRNICDIRTISMQRRPLSKYGKCDFWKYHNIKDFVILGEAYLSARENLNYFTGTGRGWNSKNNLRDFITGKTEQVFADTTDDLIKLIGG